MNDETNEMKMPECPKCGSSDYLADKKINGNTTCQKCGYSSSSKNWLKDCDGFNFIKEKIQNASDKAFFKNIELQRGHLEDDFLDMLKRSNFFKSLYNEAFIEGMSYCKTYKLKPIKNDTNKENTND